MFISFISVISVLGVCLGVMALIVVLSVQAGFEHDLKSKILGNSSHLILLKYGSEKLHDYRAVMQRIAEGVTGIEGMTPTLYHEVLLTTESNTSSGVMLKGVDPETAASVLNLGRNLISTEHGDRDLAKVLAHAEDDLPRVIVGLELSKQSLIFPGDTLTLLSPEGEITPFGNTPRLRKFRVAGIFKTGMWEYDTKFVYTHLSDAQRFFSLSDVCSYIEMRITDLDQPKATGTEVTRLLGPPYLTRDWQDLNGDLFDALRLERTVTFITLAMVILVATFSIVATLVMLVMDKSKEIAILKTMGATSAQVMRIFVLTGATIGVIGVLLGEVLGVVLSLLLRDVIRWPLNPSVYFIDTLPVQIDPARCAVVGLFTLTMVLGSTLYPSWKAASLDPVEGLRYE